MTSFDIGLVQAAFSLGLLLSSLRAERTIARVGLVRTFAATAALLGASILVLGLVPLKFWFLFRFVSGLAIGAFFVVIESWVLTEFEKNKGRAIGIYTLTLYLSLSFSQLILGRVGESAALSIIAAALLCTSAVVPISLTSRPQPTIAPEEREMPWALALKSPLGILGAFSSGITLGSLYAFMPGLILERGFDPGRFMSVMIFGGAVLQIPLGLLSDWVDRRLILLGMAASGMGSTWLAYQASSNLTFSMAIFFVGMSYFAIYPLSSTISADCVHTEEFAQMSGIMFCTYGIGAVLGPLATSALVGMTSSYMAVILGFVSVSLVAGVLGSLIQRPSSTRRLDRAETPA